MIYGFQHNKFDQLENRVLSFIRQNNIAVKPKILVAVSGGPDSVCLLHILYNIRQELNLSLQVVHLDHRLRGVESETEARYVTELARRLDLPATIESRDVSSYQAKYRLSLEEAAREVRYSFIAETGEKVGVEQVAVGHTKDDNVETILMHLIRGSGTRGLIGLHPSNIWRLGEHRIEIVRPLLSLSREETRQYCARNNLSPKSDSSNLSLSPLRNNIRLQLLPVLKSYNPNITDTLLRTARIAADELDVISYTGDNIYEKTVKVKKRTAIIDKAKIITLQPALQRYIIRKSIELLRSESADPLKDIEAIHIEDILDTLYKPAGKTIRLPYGLVFTVEYERFLLAYDPTVLSPFPPFSGEFLLNVPGSTNAGTWKVRTEIIPVEQIKKGCKLTAYFDFKNTSDILTLDVYRHGDRFWPLGMTGSKKVSEFMIDARVPHAWRHRIPVLRSPEQIIWLVGYRIDERVKVTERTEQVLKIRMIPTSNNNKV